MKRFLIIFGAIVVLILGIVGYETMQLKTERSQNKTAVLSARAQQYLKEKRASNDPFWDTVHFDSTKNTTSQEPVDKKIDVGDCFSVVISSAVRNADVNADNCELQAYTLRPNGLLRAYERAEVHTNYDDISDVHMRKLFSDKFHEEKKVINDKEFIVYREDSDAYKKVAFYLHDNRLFILSFDYNTNENLDEFFNRVLASVEFK